jgi:hypothetical protein
MLRLGLFISHKALMLSLLTAIAVININSARCEDQAPAASDSVQNPLAEKFPPAPGLYAAEPVPLTPAQCGQCHPSAYRDLKTGGGRHSFQCDNCHTRFHAFNPTKQNWQELMPKCATCHIVPPHGPKLATCHDCHGNPHAPKQIPMSTELINSCNTCHSSPFEQLQDFPSAHTKLQCRNCHISHGYIPGCNACHKAHFPGQDFKTCAMECHPVHMPREIKYKTDVDPRACGACHSPVLARWSASSSKHASVNCAACHHTKHGYIPVCTECHSLPHSKELHQHFPNCQTCHQDAHNPPVKRSGK